MDLSVTLHNAQAISDALLNWYSQHGRKSLPWQKNRTAYKVWLSEVMLQQTQVSTVIPYFEAFTQRFPTIEQLAKADIDDVLHLWTGLGYYARARNLHKCAQQITEKYHGEFPNDAVVLETLPGIGRSTAAAIVAQAYNTPAAILDGNVKRFLARLHCVPGWPGQSKTLKVLWQLAEHYTPNTATPNTNASNSPNPEPNSPNPEPNSSSQASNNQSQAYTQAVMDLGALVCTRRNPKCEQCPIQDWCAARATASQHDFPASKPKKINPVRHSTLYLLRDNERGYLLLQRPPTGIWGGLWSLPDADETEQLLNQQPVSIEKQSLEHKFSHFTLKADIYLCHLTKNESKQIEQGVREQGQRWYKPEQPDSIGLPGPIYKLLHG
ncbi:A/G-specific adenine glycosylase [Oceanospirillum maris]|uniref:A/G-specific adenine glycosylase n=1 Tax=Oceanospirillum maris TaxID=64977 RepID=UPI0003F66E44|nr:A/G-specific adenine glycosylase [Oceanospirillum maris]